MESNISITIRKARRERGLTLQQVADAIGVSYPAVQQWEAGKTHPSTENLLKLQNVLHADLVAGRIFDLPPPSERPKYRPIELSEETGERSKSGDAHVHPNADIQPGPAYLPARGLLPNDVPELGLMVGGDGDDDSVFEFNGTTVDYHPRPPGLARRPNVFVLRVSNSSMSPRFEDGDIEYIELRNPSVGEYVVVELKPEVEDSAGRSYIKRLVKADARKIVVEQFNPPGFMEFGRNEIRRLFRVITAKKELIG